MAVTTEVYSWMEGQVYWSTGNPFVSSAYLGLLENSTVTLKIGYVSTPAAGGTYHDHTTGQRADVSIGSFYCFDKTGIRWLSSATAVHMKFIHSSVNGTAGVFLYSGRIESMAIQGSNGQVYKVNMSYYANSWSSF